MSQMESFSKLMKYLKEIKYIFFLLNYKKNLQNQFWGFQMKLTEEYIANLYCFQILICSVSKTLNKPQHEGVLLLHLLQGLEGQVFTYTVSSRSVYGFPGNNHLFHHPRQPYLKGSGCYGFCCFKRDPSTAVTIVERFVI